MPVAQFVADRGEGVVEMVARLAQPETEGEPLRVVVGLVPEAHRGEFAVLVLATDMAAGIAVIGPHDVESADHVPAQRRHIALVVEPGAQGGWQREFLGDELHLRARGSARQRRR